jgi:hypothetical protein
MNAIAESNETQAETMTTSVPKIHAAIINVMAEIGAIEKTQKNTQQGFMFRGVGDAMAACQPLFVKHKMYVRPLRVAQDYTKDNIDRDGKARGLHSRQTIVYRATSAEDGSYVDSEATGEAIDYADKSAGKVMSVSFKFLLFQMFCIPDHNPENDPDGQSPGLEGGNGSGNGQGAKSQQNSTQQTAQGKPAADAAKAAEDEKAKAIKGLVDLLKRKGLPTKKILPWLSGYTVPKRELKKLGEINGGEFEGMETAAKALPEPGSQPAE